ncbi:hypothetical protein BSKO_07294 [Bryopsis sp. KO-2023]|nr:hypothetical protein BSKO_07294 [Bryopsis sp. KO-2023]
MKREIEADPCASSPTKRARSWDGSRPKRASRERSELIQRTLSSVFGFSKFRGSQEFVIRAALDGRDALVLMPTGGGKSLCYTLPAVLLPGVTVVVSPLIALMEDQVALLSRQGIHCEYMSSTRSKEERDSVMADLKSEHPEIKLLYVTPEMVDTRGFRSMMMRLYLRGLLSLFAIDEAHCISSWGPNFRPAYRRLYRIRRDFPRAPVMALTATASRNVQNDILQSLGVPEAKCFISSFNRPNIHYSVVFADVARQDTFEVLKSLLLESGGEGAQCSPSIVYALKQETTVELANRLRGCGISSKAYHGGLPASTRSEVLAEWQSDKVKVVVATVAFGMGINKPDVRLVVHYDLPKTMDGFYQESGRAGRDGLEAESVIIYSLDFRKKMEFILAKEDEKLEKQNKDKRQEDACIPRSLRAFDFVVQYCLSMECRRKFALRHLGEEISEDVCESGCDVCRNPTEVESSLETLRALTLEKNISRRQNGAFSDEEGSGERATSIGENTKEDTVDTEGSRAAGQAVSEAMGQNGTMDDFIASMETAEREFESKQQEDDANLSKTERLVKKLAKVSEKKRPNSLQKGVISQENRDRAVGKLKEALRSNSKLKLDKRQIEDIANSLEENVFAKTSSKPVYLSQLSSEVRRVGTVRSQSDLATSQSHRNNDPDDPSRESTSLHELVGAVMAKAESLQTHQQNGGDSSREEVLEREVVRRLRGLSKFNVSVASLKQNDNGKRVTRLRKHPNSRVARAAQTTVAEWRKRLSQKACEGGG